MLYFCYQLLPDASAEDRPAPTEWADADLHTGHPVAPPASLLLRHSCFTHAAARVVLIDYASTLVAPAMPPAGPASFSPGPAAQGNNNQTT